MELEQLVRVWRTIIKGPEKSWVLFRHGTCVLVLESGPDLAADARALLARWGPVVPGGPAGDFQVVTLSTDAGRVVSSHHPEIFTYVAAEEIGHGRMTTVQIGLLGRARRDHDARDLEVVHVEDRRPSIPQ